MIWVERETEYFYQRGWTVQIDLKSLRKIALARDHRQPMIAA
jgi:hypothetical protein